MRVRGCPRFSGKGIFYLGVLRGILGGGVVHLWSLSVLITRVLFRRDPKHTHEESRENRLRPQYHQEQCEKCGSHLLQFTKTTFHPTVRNPTVNQESHGKYHTSEK